MEVIVTGGAGYIGAHVVEALLNSGHEVIVIDNFSTGFNEFVNPKAQLVVGAVEDTGILNSAFSTLKSPETAGVIHIAGLKYAGESVKQPLDFYLANTVAVINLLRQMKISNVTNLVFSSSSSVYGSLNSEEAASEKASLNPLSPYGRSKLFSEKIINDAKAEFPLNSISLRYFNVIGNGLISAHDRSTRNLLPNIYRAFESGETIEVFGGNYQTPDGTCVRDYVDVNSLSNAHVQCLEMLTRTDSVPESLNLGSGAGLSVFEVLQIAKKIISPQLGIKLMDGRPGDPARIIADCSLAQRVIGWNPDINFEKIIASGWKAWQESTTHANFQKGGK